MSRQVMRAAAGAAIAVMLLVALPTAAPAGPMVNVRARTRLKIDMVARTYDGARVIGRLLEQGLGGGVAGAQVFVKIEGQEQLAETKASGRFEAEFPLSRGDYVISVRFAGDNQYDASAIENYPFNLSKGTLDLTLRVPPDMDTKATGMEVAIEARADGQPQRVPVDLAIGGLSGDLREVQRVTTGDDGRVTVTLPRAQLGAPGEKRVKVVFDGDDAFNPDSEEATFRVTTATTFRDVTLPTGQVKSDAKLVGTGRLIDSDGEPVRGATVALMAAGKKIASASTDDDGHFRVSRKATEFAAGPVSLAVEYVSTTAWRRGARTTPVTITVLPPRPVPIAYTILAFSATAAVLLGFVLARTKPWRPLLAWLRLRRRSPETTPTAATLGGAAAPETGLKLARPGLMSTLRRAGDLGVSGSVRDVISGAGVGGARVVFVHERSTKGLSHAAYEVRCDEHGHFEVTELAPGSWRGEAAAHGYVTERFAAQVPHRGELRGVRIDLLPVRERLFAIYRDVAQPLLPKPELWGVWTPREIFDHVRSRRPAGALSALTDFVEEAYFSARIPDETILPLVVSRAQAVRAEVPN